MFLCIISRLNCSSNFIVIQLDGCGLDFDLPKRPGPGTQGRRIALISNFYAVEQFPDQIIHYDVTISDGRTEDDFPKELNLSIVEELIRQNSDIFRSKPVYDAKKSLYSIHELPFMGQVSANNTLFKTVDTINDKLICE